MSQTHAHPDKHTNHSGDAKAMHEADAAGVEAQPIPAPEEGSHARSHAAHLHAPADAHTLPAGNLRQGSAPGALKQPPQEISRAGKQHRD